MASAAHCVLWLVAYMQSSNSAIVITDCKWRSQIRRAILHTTLAGRLLWTSPGIYRSQRCTFWSLAGLLPKSRVQSLVQRSQWPRRLQSKSPSI
ncbi:hypothetical protein LY76DRAFT_50400 [Colletotrichum caudatum]|nr:hypothetical protein LY76DRAFT_50400 [Colletotrichum caudatum]